MKLKVARDATPEVSERKVPILMYHEVSSYKSGNKIPHHLTPIYDLSVSAFENQIKMLAENGFHTVTLGTTSDIDPWKKNIVLTFDDGLAGNFFYALPILKKYGFRAVFFVMVDGIGTQKYMSWNQLRELSANGMEVQSHTLSHRPLQTLSSEEIYRELRGSKEKVEQELGIEVSALSFPHGSFNEAAVTIAAEVGYRTLCTSEATCNPVQAFEVVPAILGRIAITSKFDLQQYQRCAECEIWEMRRQRVAKEAKSFVKRIIGIENYRRLYRKYFNISEP
jgi:peptidoglycan/xylan/chitin deacetylase (PgdA/CDA1 family)